MALASDPVRYRGAIKLQRDRCFSEFLTPLGGRTARLTTAQQNLGLGACGRVDVTLTQAQLQGMFATPVTLVAAVAGQTAVVEGPIFYRYTYATGAYGGGGAIVIQYHTGTLATSFTLAMAQLGASSTENIVCALPATATALVPTIGDSIEITNATGAITGGGGTLRVAFTYLLF